MNYLCQAICLLCFLTTSCQSTLSSLSTPEHVRLGDQEMDSFAKEVKVTDKLQLLGTGGGFLDGIDKLILTFSSEDAPTLDEARMAYYDISSRFLNRVNQNEAIRPYLVDYPFTIENLELMILFFGDTPGRIKAATMAKSYKHIKHTNSVYYMIDHPITKKTETVFQELYDQGLEWFEKQPQKNQVKK